MQIETSEIRNESPKKGIWKKVYAIGLMVLVFFVGVQVGQRGLSFRGLELVAGEQNRQNAPANADWQLLWDVIDKINEKYVNRPINPQDFLYGAVSGVVNSLKDPYSVFLPPKEAQEFKQELKGTFEGIGAEIAIKNEQLVVVAPLDGSPSQKAGLKAGDRITKIDGTDASGLSVEDAVNKIRGQSGTQVKLTIVHEGSQKEEEISITREKIEVKSVEYSVKTKDGKSFGYIKMRRFGEESTGEITAAINDLLTKNIKGVVIDVRSNPGGYLDTAVDVASNWIVAGQPVVTQKFGDGTEQVFSARGNPRLRGIPTVVLINGGSASASEILSGALKDYGQATLIGEKSFGKGSVQELISLGGGADLKLTIAKWLTPKGHDLNKEGLEPDIKVELSEQDFNANRDPQLDRALEVLSSNR